MSYCAVIVEPRKHKALEFVLKNIQSHLPGWPIILFHGSINEEYVKKCTEKLSNIMLRNLGIPNLSPTEYSYLLTTVNFWQQMPTEKVLIFQTDTMLLHSRIEFFMMYDYVGAPWRWNLKVGNGGLSIRNRNAMIDAIRDSRDRRHPEDVFFSNYLYQNRDKYKLPSFRMAKSFASETTFHPCPLGVHKPWKHLRKHPQWKMFVKRYPEILQLMRLNNKM